MAETAQAPTTSPPTEGEMLAKVTAQLAEAIVLLRVVQQRSDYGVFDRIGTFLKRHPEGS